MAQRWFARSAIIVMLVIGLCGCGNAHANKSNAAPAERYPSIIQDHETYITLDLKTCITDQDSPLIQNGLDGMQAHLSKSDRKKLWDEIEAMKFEKVPDPQPTAVAGCRWMISNTQYNLFFDESKLLVTKKDMKTGGDYYFVVSDSDKSTINELFMGILERNSEQ